MNTLLLASFFACAPSADHADLGLQVSSKSVEGSPAALGVLALLNDSSTTFSVLDDDIGLDSRAATSIHEARLGGEFKTLAEVDELYFVGDSALNKLTDYAAAGGWTAVDDDDILGSWDGVEFTLGQANSTLELVNTSGGTYLDDDIALDSRAVDSILDNRPLDTVLALSELYYVGGSALTTLKDASEGEEVCETPGWDTEYVYDKSALPAGLIAVIDTTLETDDWCGESTGSPSFVKATVDRFDCEERGYTIELGQGMLEYPEIDWYIEFEVDANFDWFISACEV
jgi:hypothetical protein